MDMEKAIKGLEHCKIGDCIGCPYDPIREASLHGKHYKWELICNEQLTEDILALLKEQEVVMCKDCRFGEACKNGRGEHGIMCYNSHSASHSWAHKSDWFCADEERQEGE